MSKARMCGKQTGYVPNAKADMRHRKKVYQRSREKNKPGIVPGEVQEMRKEGTTDGKA